MRPGDTDHGMLDGNAGDVFRSLDRFLDAANCFVEFGDHALAQPARFGDAVPAIAQAVVAGSSATSTLVLALPTSMRR